MWQMPPMPWAAAATVDHGGRVLRGTQAAQLPRGTAEEVATGTTHDIQEAKMKANSEARQLVEGTKFSRRRFQCDGTPGTDTEARHGVLRCVMLVVGRNLGIFASGVSRRNAHSCGSACVNYAISSGEMIKPSVHEKVEIQVHREDWP
jgi:hypothetical protein